MRELGEGPERGLRTQGWNYAELGADPEVRCHWQSVGGYHIDSKKGVAGTWENTAAGIANHHSL